MDHFKVFIEFVRILLQFYVLDFWPWVILTPCPGIEATPPALEGEVLTTGPPGKSPSSSVFCAVSRNFFFLLYFYFTILYWFCHTLTWIHHGCTCVPKHEPPSHLPPHNISLGHPHAPAPSILYPALDIDWWFISYMIVCMFQCHSPKSSHPLPLPQSPKVRSTHLRLFLTYLKCVQS